MAPGCHVVSPRLAAVALAALLAPTWAVPAWKTRLLRPRIFRISTATAGLLLRGHRRQEPRGVRLYIVSPVDVTRAEQAARLERLWARHLGPRDFYANVCGYQGSGCRAAIEGRLRNATNATTKLKLHNLVELERPFDGYFPDGSCHTLHERSQCKSGYWMGNMKFPAGFVEQVRAAKSAGNIMPQWWLIKDDDTYVNVPNLMEAVRNVNPNSLVAFSHMADPETSEGGFVGGGGVLLSGALAERLALLHGDAWLQAQARAIEDPEIGNHRLSGYDRVLYEFIAGTIPKAEIVDLPAMQGLRLDADPCTHVIRTHDRCHRLKHCLCARSLKPATWHLKFVSREFSKALGYVEDM